jgi:hypothetical protein
MSLSSSKARARTATSWTLGGGAPVFIVFRAWSIVARMASVEATRPKRCTRGAAESEFSIADTDGSLRKPADVESFIRIPDIGMVRSNSVVPKGRLCLPVAKCL